MGGLHSRTREEIHRYPSTYLLFCWGKSLQADPRRCRKTPHPLWLCQGLQRPSPRSCATPHLGERSAPHWRPSRPCHQAAGNGHPAAYPPGCTRPVEVPSEILLPRYQTLLVPTVQAGRQEVEPPPNISIAFDGKTHSSPNAIARTFNRQFTASSAQQDRAIRRLMRNIHHHHHLVDRSYRPFDVRGVAAAIRKAGSSAAQGPDGLTVLHVRHLGPHGLAFLTELFNLSVAGINIPAIWKSFVIIPILKAGKPHEQSCSYRPISLLCPAAKILEWLILLAIVEVLGTRSSQHGFKPRHSLLPISASVVSSFNQRKPPSRTITIAVEISKAFDTVSHRLLIEMTHHSRLCHNLVRCLVAYLRLRKASCLYQQHQSPSRQVRAGVPQGSVISPALFNHFVSGCPISDLDMTSYANDFTLLASAPSIVEAEARANQLCAILVRWADGKQLANAPNNRYPPVPTPPSGANRWRSGSTEQDP